VDESAPIRFIASTVPGLDEEVAAGRFHDGLFYRLAPVRLVVPPLRDRREDIAVLARKLAGGGASALTQEILADLTSRPWPGNVRELRGVLAAFAALGALPSTTCRRGALLPLALDEIVDVRRPYAEQKDALTERFTERYLRALLAHTEGNQSVAAKLAGLDRSYLGKLVAKLGLK
jgi:DNA-binding NtrC family response regulator